MIPDPIERLESVQERLAYDWQEAQRDMPEGFWRCPYCSKVYALREFEPIALSAAPDSAYLCYDCLPHDRRKAYDSATKPEEVPT